MTVFRNNADCGLFVGKAYGSLSASNIVKSSTCTATSYENDDNTRQVTSRANVSSVYSTIQGEGEVISPHRLDAAAALSPTASYMKQKHISEVPPTRLTEHLISKINNGNYTARITAAPAMSPLLSNTARHIPTATPLSHNRQLLRNQHRENKHLLRRICRHTFVFPNRFGLE